MPRLSAPKTHALVLATVTALSPVAGVAQVIYPTTPVAPAAYPYAPTYPYAPAYPSAPGYPAAPGYGYGYAPGYGAAVPPGYALAPGYAYGQRPFGQTTDTRPGQTVLPTDQAQNTGATVPASYEEMRNPNSKIYGRYETLNSGAGPLRQQILTRAARGDGIRQGFAEEAARLNASIDATYADQLDARYDFRSLMIGQSLVPPVITEIRRVGERGGDRLLYLTLGAFEITKPARLTLTAPNWRDYLQVRSAQGRSASSITPQDTTEQDVWDGALAAGVAAGVAEARAAFSEAFNRLDRDYQGMARYHELASQGAVSLPVVNVSSARVRIAEGGRRAFVGEKVVTLRVTPTFRAAQPAAFN